jgi:thiol-disulfide isomerase/thioredoxin
MKNLSLFLLCLFLINCKKTEETKNEQTVKKIKISGEVANCEADTLFLFGEANFFEKLAIKDGKFSKEIEIPYRGIVTFEINFNSKFIYVEDGFDLNIKLDCNDFNKSFIFSGKGADENNFGAKKYEILVKNYGDFSEESNKKLYSLPENDFLAIHDQYSTDIKKLLSDSQINNDYFNQMELEDLKYHILSHSKTYQMLHGQYTNQPNFKVSVNFPKPNNNFVYNQDLFLFSYSYKNLLNDNFFNTNNDFDKETNFFSKLKKLQSIDGNILKNKLVFDLINFGLHPDFKDLDKIGKNLLDLASEKELKKAVTIKIEQIKKLAKGTPSPTFNYEDHTGKMVKLEDLKGKYVYVDLWATWCSPCMQEAPFFNEVAKKYANKKIHFVGISLDSEKDKDLWKKAIKDKNLQGIQVLANRKDTPFVDAFAIRGIPQFVLLDPKGKIVNSDPPRPSSPDLIKLFDELGI